ncbi:hypothetical protein SARC_06123 [Sphaeroforma arctica JP610]|uniref:Succinate dehydrogenase assembly factor 2, mitochondrial n=1 Tax=Sphaeroforma arctica JP610 TaxID=667725 RepID=A0A0L0FYF1_9EUKA|nr:hypothetical protein SARC_06123 [Sphaeroforma arctica JP610]KNC81566.1 hypothetical protein SARC_06123 [Sphaeroforma arctica JP610]|eukprot:XP_014155468.1 hypothetical protein SARC_06123 [Sphaeroforma arctica JP610]
MSPTFRTLLRPCMRCVSQPILSSHNHTFASTLLKSTISSNKYVLSKSAQRGYVNLSEDVNIPAIPPISREGESIENKRKRLVYQVRKRGMLENDLLLSTFAREYLNDMDGAELHLFDKLLDENDWDLYYWLTDKKEVPEEFNHSVFQKLKAYSKNERAEALRMPHMETMHKSAK